MYLFFFFFAFFTVDVTPLKIRYSFEILTSFSYTHFTSSFDSTVKACYIFISHFLFSISYSYKLFKFRALFRNLPCCLYVRLILLFKHIVTFSSCYISVTAYMFWDEIFHTICSRWASSWINILPKGKILLSHCET